ncbi:hypothetical protein HanXRQr2_Chr01g0042351 [Helianthus annuus]|uniref:Uncharacterized protein n=1 Tax=Helianthus annuus TaxID=4232 RepID=A0A251TQF4_HELAN|nr:hypothetical protein HanXRQr2_Chr01g0042351 [Helianthus annuus]KAJ0958644.1 hypothetical protein HanPSC8_Chr01g0041191 [Helianthus annuus]
MKSHVVSCPFNPTGASFFSLPCTDRKLCEGGTHPFGKGFSAWVHSDIWVICIISLCSNWLDILQHHSCHICFATSWVFPPSFHQGHTLEQNHLLVSVGFVAGALSVVYLLFPLTSSALYNSDPAIRPAKLGRRPRPKVFRVR